MELWEIVAQWLAEEALFPEAKKLELGECLTNCYYIKYDCFNIAFVRADDVIILPNQAPDIILKAHDPLFWSRLSTALVQRMSELHSRE